MKYLILILSSIIISTAAFTQKRTAPPLTAEEQFYEKYGITLFRGVDGTWFNLENDINSLSAISYLNVLHWLQGRVPGLQVYTFNGIAYPFIRNSLATVFVDEIRVDPSFLNMLPVTDIALIKVIRSPFAGVFSAPGGAIAIYTKRGESDEEEG